MVNKSKWKDRRISNTRKYIKVSFNYLECFKFNKSKWKDRRIFDTREGRKTSFEFCGC